MKRIGIEAQRLFRQRKHGMEVVALELIKELQRLDKKNEYILFAKQDTDQNCVVETDNWKIVKPHGKTYFDWEQYALPKAAKKEKLDFLHSTCNTSAITTHYPLLLTIHDVIYMEKIEFKGTPYQNFGNLYRRFIVPKVAQKSKLIITVSEFEKETISEVLKIPKEKIRVVYNAASKKFNNQYKDAQISGIKQKYGLPDSFILFIGNTAPKKNSKNVIQAYSSYCRSASSPIPLVILDYSKELTLQQLRRDKSEDLISNFVFPGFISSDELPLVYNASTLFIYPSLRESFGLPIIEAMGCGSPVITSNTSCMPEIAGEAALLINPFNPDDLTQKMIEVLGNKQLQQQLSEKGLERAKDFSWEHSAKQLIEIYEMM